MKTIQSPQNNTDDISTALNRSAGVPACPVEIERTLAQPAGGDACAPKGRRSSGIYIHIPFCKSRCSYCDFATGIYQSEVADRYVEALLRDIQITRHRQPTTPIDTIYLGGGTPSMLAPRQIERVLDTVHTNFDVVSPVEITLEINPGSVTPAGLRDFRRAGINRASFGAQTFSDAELARLGRAHDSTDTLNTFAALRETGFENISFDLIAGLPGQTMATWEANVEKSLALQPEHLSFYLLEVHSGTPLAQHIERGIQPKPDDDLAGEMYEVMLERATRAGYEHYEISNLCRAGFESRHNTKYWTGSPYFGFGCSSHSYDGVNHRWSNERDVAKYVELIERGESPVVEQSELGPEDLRAEAVFLGMRLMNGLNMREYEQLFGVNILEEHREDFNDFAEAGLVEFDGELVRLTRAGALMSNEVFAKFI
ncbi:MAG TPA: radical SAM family heme chaperone HemW [Pyrinomonadaceae bacterium]